MAERMRENTIKALIYTLLFLVLILKSLVWQAPSKKAIENQKAKMIENR